MTKPKKQIHADLNNLIDFYERQADFVGGGAQTTTGELLTTRAGFLRQPARQACSGMDLPGIHAGSITRGEAMNLPRKSSAYSRPRKTYPSARVCRSQTAPQAQVRPFSPVLPVGRDFTGLFYGANP